MLLKEYLRSQGLLTVSEFRARMEISSAQASNLWHGRDMPGVKMVVRIHERCHVPLKGLIYLESVYEQRARQPQAVSGG